MATALPPALALLRAISDPFPVTEVDIRRRLRLQDFAVDTDLATVFVARSIEAMLVLPIRMQWDIAARLSEPVGVHWERMFVAHAEAPAQRLVHERVIEQRAKLEPLIEQLALQLRRILAALTPDDPESGASNAQREPDQGGSPGGAARATSFESTVVGYGADADTWIQPLEQQALQVEIAPDYARQADIEPDVDLDEEAHRYGRGMKP
ncbi:hypothetical protein ASE35_03980 [Lysobacter sp. Root916]|uniref:hypothetical protein n=1 Tax=Lysobacter sp. Root916 TaxID=1736606 RepID=UPI000711036D|nr:hypothetical protein [Lysobacter sp. Root916]KRD39516.1 hypothetical protein ASE35_03980 [Lysobacter sp. Root916]